jgi:hypothetical protein
MFQELIFSSSAKLDKDDIIQYQQFIQFNVDLLGPTHKPAPNPTQPAKKWVGLEK